MSDSPPAFQETTLPDGASCLVLTGGWTVLGLSPGWKATAAALARAAARPGIAWDLRDAHLDHGGAALLMQCWDGVRPARLLLAPEAESMLADAEAAAPAPRQLRPADPLAGVVWLGAQAYSYLWHLRRGLELLGGLALDAVHLARHPREFPWREVSATVYRAGAQALPITALVGFLIGVVLSYLSLKQLRQFGADVFIVNILGISVLRELGPVLAAILVAGRSGSAMTAQIGVMRVTQELDAMSVMGIPHGLRLVLPKVLALAISLPFLVLWTSAMALLGGAVAAWVQTGLSPDYFFGRLPEVVPAANLWIGVGKGAAFGALVALVACHFGLLIRPDTDSLGTGTTRSVVTAITSVILANAVFAIALSDVGVR